MPMANEPTLDCYATLEVAPDADDAAIRTAFAAQVQKFGSAQFSGTPADGQQKLSDLNTDYQILIDPVRRRRYDFHRRIAAICAQTNLAADYETQPKAKPAAGKDRVAAARPGPRRVPLYVLVAAVVALTAFSTFKYSNRLPERVAASAAAPPRVAVDDHPAVRMQVAAPADETPPLYPALRADPALPTDVKTAEAKPTDKKPAGNKVASTRRRSGAPPDAALSEACTDVVAVLGLCKSKSSVENR